MTAAVHQADVHQPVAARLWAIAKAAGALIAAVPPGIGVYVYLHEPPREVVKALEIVEMYQTPLYAEAHAAVAERVDEVLKKLALVTPTDCGTDRTRWSDECKASRETYKNMVVDEFEQAMGTPEERQKFILIANFYMHAMRCVDSGNCDGDVIDAHFRRAIGLFWRQTYPYIEKAAEREVEYAQWLRDYCQTGDKCKS